MIYYTIGLPRSGKSSFCERMSNIVVVCADKIRLQLYGQRYFQGGEDYVSAVKYFMIQYLHSQDLDVLVDGTHTTQYSINKLLAIDPNAVAIYFNTSVEECKKRAITTGQHDLLPVIERMSEQLKKLDLSKIEKRHPEEFNADTFR